MSTDDLIKGYRRDQHRRGLLPGTIDRRTYEAQRWFAWCEAEGIDPFSAESGDVEDWLDAKRNLSAKTRYGMVSHLCTLYEYLMRVGKAHANPTINVLRPRLKPGLPRPIRDEDLAVALKYATPMMRCWLTLMAYGGLRCAEVAGLEREDLLESKRQMRVLGKGRKERVIPMHAEVVKALHAYGMPSRGALWRRPSGGKYTPVAVSQKVGMYLRECGIDSRAHELRHAFGTKACEAAGIRVTQDLLGHASPATTAIYTKVSTAATREAVDSIRFN